MFGPLPFKGRLQTTTIALWVWKHKWQLQKFIWGLGGWVKPLLASRLKLIVSKLYENLVSPQKWRRERVVISSQLVTLLGFEAVQEESPPQPPLCFGDLQNFATQYRQYTSSALSIVRSKFRNTCLAQSTFLFIQKPTIQQEPTLVSP